MYEFLLPYKEFVGVLAIVVTIIQFLSGSVVCLKYIKLRSTGESSGISFVCGFLSCNLWLKYGLLKQDSLVFFVNAIGCVLFFTYVLVFYRFTVKKSPIVCQFLSVCLALLTFHTYISYESDTTLAIQRTGFISCIVTFLFIASPLTLLFHVFKVRSTESLPFPIILTSFFVSSLWFIYGVIVDDAYMEVPNALGALMSLFQLSLFVYIPSTPSSTQYNKLRQVI